MVENVATSTSSWLFSHSLQHIDRLGTLGLLKKTYQAFNLNIFRSRWSVIRFIKLMLKMRSFICYLYEILTSLLFRFKCFPRNGISDLGTLGHFKFPIWRRTVQNFMFIRWPQVLLKWWFLKVTPNTFKNGCCNIFSSGFENIRSFRSRVLRCEITFV